jgi:serine protease inhibitor
MKKSITIIMLALIASAAIAQTGLNQITQTFSMKDVEELTFAMIDETTIDGQDIMSVCFKVDKDLPAPKKTIQKYDDKEIAKKIVNISGIPQSLHRVVKTSFEGQRLGYIADDNFYKCLVQAYADHHPLVLSPDMVWLIISQGFSRYVNAHTEEMRDLLVFHEGQMELVVNSNNDVLSPSGDWERLLNDFSHCIAKNTKGELADLMTADFTTTGITERIASQVSLMDVVKKYFIYTNIAAGCGIPSITLKGSPNDWQMVLDKVRSLKKYHLEKWASDLEDILKEFVKASKGNANQKFWQNIVKKRRVDQMKSDKGCLPSINSTYLDGWFLKFFPNALGETSDSVMWDTDMPQEMVRVNFRHVLTDPDTGVPIDTIPMQLWAGFVGIEEDAKTQALSPKIGWLARIADEESDEVARLKEQNKYMQLYYNIGKDQEVPHALSKMDHIRSLRLDFWDNPVVIPEWLDNILIDKLSIMGQLTDEEEAQLRQRFPKAEIKRYEDIFKKVELVPIEEESKKAKAVKAGDKISGVVGDEAGPLMGATVCEIDAKGRIIESAITNLNGAFTMKVKNPQDRIRFSYVGMKTITMPINEKDYKIIMRPAEQSHYRYIPIDGKKQTGLPIPIREVDNADISKYIDMSEYEAIGIEANGEGVSNENNPRGYIPLSDEEQALVMPVNDLGFNMFRKVGAKHNILLSPLGMTYALGLISNGAGGETKKQINKVLGCDDSGATNINEFCRKILTEAPKLDRLTQMEINNDFFSQEGYTPKPAFAKIAKEYYHTALSSLDFGSEESVDEINQKISQRSNGMLPKVLDKSNLDPLMGFVLANTIYFKSIWTDKFPKALTRDEVFKDEDGKEKKVPMMNQEHNFYYTENDLCQALCLPYSNEAYQMIVLLPKEGKTVSEVAQSLTADSWQRTGAQMRKVLVDVKLPRFESSSDVELTGVMSALGIPDAFHMGKADFSNLFDLKSSIGRISQVGRIKVDETGTEATVAEMLQGRIAGLDLIPPDSVKFYATHPFLYVIREVSTGAIFFIGQYMGN